MIHEVNSYTVSPNVRRVSFVSGADRVSLFVVRGQPGVFDSGTLEQQDFDLVQASEFHGSYDVEMDGAQRVQVWLVPQTQDENGWTTHDGTSGTLDRRRVVDLGL